MQLCHECHSHLTEESLYCSECGARVSASDDQSVVDASDIDSRLAAANLHRMRGEYVEATDQCTAILRACPENPDVHCLLGDIYADQDRVEEAMRWYQMAMDIDPESRSCADKLEELARKLADKNAADGRASWFDRFVIGENFESSIRIITFTSAGFAALLIAFGLIALFTQKPPVAAGSAAHQPGLAGPNRVNRRPLVVPPTGVDPANQSPVRTAYEDHLLYRITSAQAIETRRIQVTGARLDPRTQVLTISFKNSSDSVDRLETLSNAGALAAVGFGLSDDIKLVTLRCLAVMPDASGQNVVTLIFIADVARQSLDVLPSQPTPDQIDQVLQQPWWGSVVR